MSVWFPGVKPGLSAQIIHGLSSLSLRPRHTPSVEGGLEMEQPQAAGAPRAQVSVLILAVPPAASRRDPVKAR